MSVKKKVIILIIIVFVFVCGRLNVFIQSNRNDDIIIIIYIISFLIEALLTT